MTLAHSAFVFFVLERKNIRETRKTRVQVPANRIYEVPAITLCLSVISLPETETVTYHN